MLVAVVPTPRLIGRQPKKPVIVDIDVATVDVGKNVVRLHVPQLPEVRTSTQYCEADCLEDVIEESVRSYRMVRCVVRDVNR